MDFLLLFFPDFSPLPNIFCDFASVISRSRLSLTSGCKLLYLFDEISEKSFLLINDYQVFNSFDLQ